MPSSVAAVFSAHPSILHARHGFDPVSLARLQQVNREFAVAFGQDHFWRPFVPEGQGGVPSSGALPKSSRSAKEAYVAAQARLEPAARRDTFHLYGADAPTDWGGHLLLYGPAMRAVQENADEWLVVQAAVQSFGRLLRFASVALRSAPRLAWLAVSSDPDAYGFVEGEAKSDRALALFALTARPKLIPALPPRLGTDIDLLRAVLTRQGEALALCLPAVRACRLVVAAAVRSAGSAIAAASAELRDDTDLVRMAVAQDGEALQDVSERLRADLPTVLLAVQQDGRAVRHASSALQDHSEVANASVANRPESFAFLSSAQQQRRELALRAANDPRCRLSMLPPVWLEDEEVVRACMPRCDSEQWLLSDPMQAMLLPPGPPLKELDQDK